MYTVSLPVSDRLFIALIDASGEGAFFKAHQDTPRAADMFGSLVVVLPAPHEGGELALRHDGKEWTFDATKLLAGRTDAVAYVAFFSDVEHEVLPVRSGHRVTLTYNLYYGTRVEDTIATPSELLARAQAALAGGIASDQAVAIAQVQGQIDSLTSAIETLKSILCSTSTMTDTGYDPTTKAALPEPKVPTLDGKLPPLPAPKVGASEWTSITATYDHTKQTSDKSLSTSATHSSWNAALFFASGGQSKDDSGSSKAQVRRRGRCSAFSDSDPRT